MEAFYLLNYGSMVAGYASDSDAIGWIVHHIQPRVMNPLFGGDGQIRTDGKGLPVRWVAASRLSLLTTGSHIHFQQALPGSNWHPRSQGPVHSPLC